MIAGSPRARRHGMSQVKEQDPTQTLAFGKGRTRVSLELPASVVGAKLSKAQEVGEAFFGGATAYAKAEDTFGLVQVKVKETALELHGYLSELHAIVTGEKVGGNGKLAPTVKAFRDSVLEIAGVSPGTFAKRVCMAKADNLSDDEKAAKKAAAKAARLQKKADAEKAAANNVQPVSPENVGAVIIAAAKIIADMIDTGHEGTREAVRVLVTEAAKASSLLAAREQDAKAEAVSDADVKAAEKAARAASRKAAKAAKANAS